MLDPHLEIRRGAQLFRPLDKGVGGGGGWVLQEYFFFRPFGPKFGPKVRGGGKPPGPPLDLPLKIVQLTTY